MTDTSPASNNPLPVSSRSRNRLMFFGAFLFLFGVAIVLPPGAPRKPATNGEDLVSPLRQNVERLEAGAFADTPDLNAIQEDVLDLKQTTKTLPGEIDRFLLRQLKANEPAAESTTATPDTTAAMRLVDRLLADRWFLVGMLFLWLAIIIEGLVGIRTAADGITRAFRRWLLIVFIPPMRMAFSPAFPNREVWFPRLGWLPVSKHSFRTTERTMVMPMLLFTLSIVPIEIIERFFPHWVINHAWVSLALHLLGALIWIAFVVEFVLLLGLAPKPIQYCKRNWINILIILLPLAAFLRMLRLTRLARVLRAGKMLRVYRLRGVYVRTMRVAILLSLFDRLLKRKPERYLSKLQEKIEEKRDELEALEADAAELQAAVDAAAETPLT